MHLSLKGCAILIALKLVVSDLVCAQWSVKIWGAANMMIIFCFPCKPTVGDSI